MCLLITGKSAQIRATLLDTKGLLDDIFKSNADGVGAMYTNGKGALRTPKVLPKSLKAARAFIASLPKDDRSIAIHWRMKTHGDIDLENCHPYDVLPGQVALMHNGVLSQGNKADVTKSDTWHYIRNVVRPMLELAPGLMTNAAWLDLIENDITGSNRFAIMNADGELSVLNKHTGIEHDGMWFSNTYAWSPELLIPGYRKTYGRAWAAGLLDDEDDIWDSYYQRQGSAKSSALTVLSGGRVAVDDEEDTPVFTSEDVWNAIDKHDADELADLLWEDSFLVFDTLFENCQFALDMPVEPTKLEIEIIAMLESGDAAKCADITSRRSSNFCALVAQAAVWFGTWLPKDDTAGADKLSTEDAAELKSLTGLSEDEYQTALAEYRAALDKKDADKLDVIDPEVAALTAGSACVSEYAG
jgi:hypothetical protein